MTWRWVVGSRWRVDGVSDEQGPVDYDSEEGANGWIFYDNKVSDYSNLRLDLSKVSCSGRMADEAKMAGADGRDAESGIATLSLSRWTNLDQHQHLHQHLHQHMSLMRASRNPSSQPNQQKEPRSKATTLLTRGCPCDLSQPCPWSTNPWPTEPPLMMPPPKLETIPSQYTQRPRDPSSGLP